MSLSISVQTSFEKAKRKLARLGKEFSSNDAANLIGLGFVEWIDLNFKASGGNAGFGGKWKALSPNTVASRRKGSSSILQDTGRLKNSFNHKIRGTGDGSFIDIGTDVKYAKFHEEGTDPYVIFPSRKKALAFKVSGSSKRIVRTTVNHPGLPKRKMLPTVSKANLISFKIFTAYVSKVTKEVEAIS